MLLSSIKVSGCLGISFVSRLFQNILFAALLMSNPLLRFLLRFVTVCYGMLRKKRLFGTVPRLNSQFYGFSQHSRSRLLRNMLPRNGYRRGVAKKMHILLRFCYGRLWLSSLTSMETYPCAAVSLLRFLLRFVTVCYGKHISHQHCNIFYTRGYFQTVSNILPLRA